MTTKRELKNSIYSEISRIGKALSNPNRLEIIDFIANGAKSVEDIALQVDVSIANASQHLQVLKRERLVQTSKKGNHIYYSLASMDVYLAWKNLRDLTRSTTPHVDRLMDEIRENNSFDKPFSLDKIKGRTDVCLLDVRPKDEFDKGHIPNAISVPIKELSIRLDEIPRDKLVVAYCRGMFCSIADEAVNMLHEKGFNAKKIEESVLDYKIETAL